MRGLGASPETRPRYFRTHDGLAFSCVPGRPEGGVHRVVHRLAGAGPLLAPCAGECKDAADPPRIARQCRRGG